MIKIHSLFIITVLYALTKMLCFSFNHNPNSYTVECFQKVSDTPCIPKTDTLAGQKVYRKVEKAAEFPGGQGEFTRYLQRNLRYPESQDDLQGWIRLTFIVDTFGNLRNICLLNSPDPNYLSAFDSSVIKMFQTMPKWVPAIHNGKKVIFRHIQAIHVHLE